MNGINGHHEPNHEPHSHRAKSTSYFYDCTDNDGSNGAPAAVNGDINAIPPPQAHNQSEHMSNVTIPLNNVPAFTPSKRLRIVTIGAGYAGMTLAQKIQHKYAQEMDKYIHHTIFEAKDSVGGTWIANTYPGVMCDVPSAIYVLNHLSTLFSSNG